MQSNEMNTAMVNKSKTELCDEVNYDDDLVIKYCLDFFPLIFYAFTCEGIQER